MAEKRKQRKRRKPQAMSFTDAKVRKLPAAAPGRRDFYVDSHRESGGLKLFITPTGHRTYYVRLWRSETSAMVVIGEADEMEVKAARLVAMAHTTDHRLGNDVATRIQEQMHGMTVNELFKKYLSGHAKPRKRTWKEDERNHKLHLKDQLGGYRLARLRQRDVRTWHAEIGTSKGRTVANRALALLSSMFTFAIQNEHLRTEVNPCRGVRRFTERTRERFLSPAEVPKFFEALADDAGTQRTTVWRDFFLTCLFVGARRGNVQRMRWKQLDLKQAAWAIPGSETKNGRPVVLALPPVAVELLEARKAAADADHAERVRTDLEDGRERPKRYPWVFPGGSKAGHLGQPRAAWERIRKLSGLADLRIHDLRRTLGSWQAAAGTSLPIIGRSLGHTDLASTQIYSRLDLDPVRASVEAATTALVAAAATKIEEVKE